MSLASILSGVWGHSLQKVVVTTDGPEETYAVGEALGAQVTPGTVVLLSGDLGAGKTCFAQGVASGLEVPDDHPVTSPSYTLLNVHHGRFPLYHFDLYRLSRVDDLADLGYDDFAEGDGLTLVEWADRMAGGLAASLSVEIKRLSDQQRELVLVALDGCGEELVANLSDLPVS